MMDMMGDSVAQRRASIVAAQKETAAQMAKLAASGSSKWYRRCKVFMGFFVTIWVIPLMYIFFYTTQPIVVWFTMAILLAMSLWPMMSGGGHALAAISVAITILNIVWGMSIYYSHVLFMQTMEGGREYEGVFAGEQPLAYSDAAVLNFAGSARVDASRAVGFKSLHGQMHTYCIAPIIDDTFTSRAEFWAVGIDCCGERGNFECDNVGQSTSQIAVVLPHPEMNQDPLFGIGGKHFAPPLYRHDVFTEALDMASKVHRVQAGETPLFVKWTNTHRDNVIEDEWSAIKVTILWAFWFAFFCSFIQTILAFRFMDVQMFEQNLEMQLAKSHHLSTSVPLAIAMFIDENAPQVPQTPKWLRELAVTHCLIPWCTLMTCVLIWSFLYSTYIGHILMGIFVLVMSIEIFGLLMSNDKYVTGLGMTAIMVIGMYIGRHNYVSHTFRYYAVQNHRSYSNVLPDARAEEYRDAGKLVFADNAQLMTNMSVGFMLQSTNYCAAPIMARGDWSPTNVDFWAIGENCCDSRGNFHCGDAKDPKARGGVVFHDINHEDSKDSISDPLHLHYLKAVHSARDLHGLYGDDDPTLLIWGPNLKELHYKWMNEATGVVIMTAIVALQILGCGTLVSFCYGRAVYKSAIQQYQADLQRQHHAETGGKA